MKITKHTSVTSSKNDTEELNKSILDDAANSVQTAINSLSALVRRSEASNSDSELIKDCIVDLSTVLLTLKG